MHSFHKPYKVET